MASGLIANSLGLRGKYDQSIEILEPEAHRRDLPNAVAQILQAGHFALGTRRGRARCVYR
jgi:hypothetical protein